MKKCLGFVLAIVIMIFVAAGCIAAIGDENYKIEKKNITIENFFAELDYQVIVHRENIPEDIRNKRVFRYVIATTDRVSFKEVEKEMPDAIVLFTPNCEEFYIFTDHIKK